MVRSPSVSQGNTDSLKLSDILTAMDPTTWSLEARIEALFVDLLDGTIGDTEKSIDHGTRGDKRRIVLCQEVESMIFGKGIHKPSPDENANGGGQKKKKKKKKKKKRGLSESLPSDEPVAFDESDLDDYALEDEVGGVPIHLDYPRKKEKGLSHSQVENINPQLAEANLQRRRAGQEKADQRELVRQAGRRGVVFGFWHLTTALAQRKQGTEAVIEGAGEEEEEVKRKVEIVQRGKVVEGSFAKGEWGVRWVE